jgi:four helix bundle protein
MTPEALKARTKKFAVDIIRFAKKIPSDHINREITSQLTDAATSTAAHYRAVCRAKSRADFINKLSGGIEEVDESALWLEIHGSRDLCRIGNETVVERGGRAHANFCSFARNGEEEAASAQEPQIHTQRSSIDKESIIANHHSPMGPIICESRSG